MFTLEEIQKVTGSAAYLVDYANVRQSLAQARFQQKHLLDPDASSRLTYLVDAALASIPQWDQQSSRITCGQIAEIAECLASGETVDSRKKRNLGTKAAILYEFAGQPAMSSAVANEVLPDKSKAREFFGRHGYFGLLNYQNGSESKVGPERSLAVATVHEDFRRASRYIQGHGDAPDQLLSQHAWQIATVLDIGLPASVIEGVGLAIKTRFDNSTRSKVDEGLFSLLGRLQFPAELWRTQTQAIERGLLDPQYDSWGLAAPTGSGKTFICRLLLAHFYRNFPKNHAIYIAPTRALVNEVADDLERFLEPLNIVVTAVTPHLTPLDGEEAVELAATDLAILTPEKADLLLRLGAEYLKAVRLVIVDEAHLLESETRGVLLELYLWRIRKLLPADVRIIFLSAVAPNVDAMARWMGKSPGYAIVNQRPTRMRAGVFRPSETTDDILGTIAFSDGTSVGVPGKAPKSVRLLLLKLCLASYVSGPVLIVCRGKSACEDLALFMAERFGDQTEQLLKSSKEVIELRARLDSRLEREMYADVPLRRLLKLGIVYHHAGMPPRVRNSVEELIRKGGALFVFATTTLAEGVNFPFSTVIVQSLAIREPPEKGVMGTRYRVITPRSFWNIAGRAGRPGHEREGQVILFEPSLGIQKVQLVLDNYLNPDANSVGPVTSAISLATRSIIQSIAEKTITLDDLSLAILPKTVPKRIRGMLNLFRVGLIHARAAKIAASPEEIVAGSFAGNDLKAEERRLLVDILVRQAGLIEEFLKEETTPSAELIAEIGISLETFTALREYARGLKDWQIERYGSSLFYGPNVNLEQAKYIVGPVAKRMSELDGGMLGGHLSDAIVQWISGVPLAGLKDIFSKSKVKSLEQLISVIYSRVQFLLPWGLFAFDRIVEAEALRRKIKYENQIEALAGMADQGVPSYDALHLVRMDFERVDATRLAAAYFNSGVHKSGKDIISWLTSQDQKHLEKIVHAKDNRRIDYDFAATVAHLRAAPSAHL